MSEFNSRLDIFRWDRSRYREWVKRVPTKTHQGTIKVEISWNYGTTIYIFDKNFHRKFLSEIGSEDVALMTS